MYPRKQQQRTSAAHEMNVKLIGGGLLISLALVLLLGGSRVVAPITHLVGVLNGTISPSSGNLGVLAGEFLIYVAVAGVAYLFLRFGFKLLDRRKAEAER